MVCPFDGVPAVAYTLLTPSGNDSAVMFARALDIDGTSWNTATQVVASTGSAGTRVGVGCPQTDGTPVVYYAAVSSALVMKRAQNSAGTSWPASQVAVTGASPVQGLSRAVVLPSSGRVAMLVGYGGGVFFTLLTNPSTGQHLKIDVINGDVDVSPYTRRRAFSVALVGPSYDVPCVALIDTQGGSPSVQYRRADDATGASWNTEWRAAVPSSTCAGCMDQMTPLALGALADGSPALVLRDGVAQSLALFVGNGTDPVTTWSRVSELMPSGFAPVPAYTSLVRLGRTGLLTALFVDEQGLRAITAASVDGTGWRGAQLVDGVDMRHEPSGVEGGDMTVCGMSLGSGVTDRVGVVYRVPRTGQLRMARNAASSPTPSLTPSLSSSPRFCQFFFVCD